MGNKQTCCLKCGKECKRCVELTTEEIIIMKDFFMTHIAPELVTILTQVIQSEMTKLSPALESSVTNALRQYGTMNR